VIIVTWLRAVRDLCTPKRPDQLWGILKKLLFVLMGENKRCSKTIAGRRLHINTVRPCRGTLRRTGYLNVKNKSGCTPDTFCIKF
jgi:hypothetical protein